MYTKNVFRILAIFMIGFGIMMGIAFPFFVLVATEVSAEVVLTPLFFSMCIMAGFLVGLFNIYLARKIVGKKLAKLSSQMRYVEKRLNDRTNSLSLDNFDDENCYSDIDSDDVIGDSAKAFNALVGSLSDAIKSEYAVRNFTEMLSSKLDLNELAREALSKLMENLNAAGGAIIVEKEGALQVLSSFGITSSDEIISNDIVWSVIKNNRRHLINLPEDILLSGLLTNYRPKSVLLEPIIYKEVVLGIVVLASVVEFTNEMQKNIRLFGQGLALAFKNAITHDQLQRLAANDPLTGIYNRRFGLSRLREEFARSVKTSLPIGVLMFDIDHFKAINDAYGHIVGDRVLISIVQVAKMSLREGDIFLRYGGEEFLIILPGASLSDTAQIGERLRRTIEETEIHNAQQSIKITISIGGTSYPEHSVDDFMSLVNISDTKLFLAKECGRNKAIIE